MKGLTLLLLLILKISGYVVGQKTNIKNDNIYQLEQNTKKNTLKIGFIHSGDSAKYVVTSQITKEGLFKYIKIGNQKFYLNVDPSVSLVEKICMEFKKIESDTAIKLGEPMGKSSSIVLLISQTGEITNIGIRRVSGDHYYDDQTLRLLEKVKYMKSEPSLLSGIPVSYLLMVSYVFNQGGCIQVGKF